MLFPDLICSIQVCLHWIHHLTSKDMSLSPIDCPRREPQKCTRNSLKRGGALCFISEGPIVYQTQSYAANVRISADRRRTVLATASSITRHSQSKMLPP